MRIFYLIMAIIGGVVPWIFFGSWFSQNGLSPISFLMAVFQNDAANAFAIDVVISSLVFLVWSFSDARKTQTPLWWLVLIGNLTVGLSLALPLYLWLREGKTQAETAA